MLLDFHLSRYSDGESRGRTKVFPLPLFFDGIGCHAPIRERVPLPFKDKSSFHWRQTRMPRPPLLRPFFNLMLIYIIVSYLYDVLSIFV